LFYHCNIMNDEKTMCVYWLSSSHFIEENGDISSRRPVGHHSKYTLFISEQIECVNECIAEASLLDRFSSIVSAYYILVGIFVAMYRMLGPCTPQDWPYFPLSLTWTLPAIYKRVYGGKIIVNDPRKILRNDIIHLKNHGTCDKIYIDIYVIITALFSILIPWITVLLAYFTRPIGFGEKEVNGNVKIHCWFCFCGILITIFLILLALLSHTTSWWVVLFGEACDISDVCNQP
ncbi:41325_t:CDS:2, partial [Gigaspora margarita]